MKERRKRRILSLIIYGFFIGTKKKILKKGLKYCIIEKAKELDYDFCYHLDLDKCEEYWSKFLSRNSKRKSLVYSCFSVENFLIDRLAFSLNTLKNLKKANINTTRDLLV